MPLPQQNFVFNDSIQRFGRRELDRSVSSGMGSVFRDPTLRPTEMLGHLSEAFPEEYGNVQGAMNNPVTAPLAAYMGAAKQAATLYNEPMDLPEFEGVEEPEDEMLSPQQVEYEYGHLGLRSKEPVRRSQMDYMASVKQKERRDQEIWDAAPGGLTSNAAYLGAGLVGAAIDPLNIATGFVPLGALTGKAATMLGSKVAGRMAIGGVEGFLGNAAVEPIIAYGAQQMQLDYTMADAAMNLLLGTALGSGIHAGGGAIKDMATVKRARLRREETIRGMGDEGGQQAAPGGPKPRGPAPRQTDPSRLLEFRERDARSKMSEVGREITSNAMVVRAAQGGNPRVDPYLRIDNKARELMAIEFNARKPDRAVGYQLRRMRMYDMARGREDLDYLTRQDIEAAERDFLDAAERANLGVRSIDEFKEKYPEYWRNTDPVDDAEIKNLVDTLKAEREQWNYSRKNPTRMETLFDIIRKAGGLDPDSLRAAELRAILGGKNKSLGRGVNVFRKKGKGGPGLDDIGELATGIDKPYIKRPEIDEILDDLREHIHGSRVNDSDVPLYDILGVHPKASDEAFERAARLHVAEKLRPEPDADTWNRAAAESPDEIRAMQHDEDTPPVRGHLDDEIEYSLDDIRRQDTDLDKMLQELRDEGLNLDPEEFKTVWDDWITNEEAIDDAFGVGFACVRNG